MYERTNDANIFNSNKFLSKLDDYIRQNERLRIENEKLRKQTTDPNFATALEEANKKLNDYDNEGYQQILENYKFEKKNKINEEQREISQASYLQAQNNYLNYKFELALTQINEALNYNNDNVDFLFFKAKTLLELFNYDESINTFLKVSTISNNDSLKSESYSYIRLVYDAKGYYDESLEYSYKALDIRQKFLGKEHPSTSISYNLIGLAYYHKGDFNTALEFYSKALTIQEKVDAESLSIATLFNNLGLIYDEKGEYDTALEYFNKSFDILKKYLGKEDLQVAYLYNSIGAVYYHKKNYNKALEYYNKALVIDEKVLGKEHLTTAATYNNIGSVYQNKIEYEKALFYRRKALAICEKVLGKEHVLTANAYNNIGSVYEAEDDHSTALKYYITALNIQEKVLDKENPYLATSYNNIAYVYYKRSNYLKAIEYYNKALVIREKVYGPKHPNTKQIYQNLALAFLAKGEKEKGVNYLKISPFSEVMVSDKINTSNNWAIPMLKAKKCREAANLLDLALKFMEDDNFDRSNSLWIVIYRNIARAYCCKGDKEKALSLFKKAIFLCGENNEGKTDVSDIKRLYEACKIK